MTCLKISLDKPKHSVYQDVRIKSALVRIKFGPVRIKSGPGPGDDISLALSQFGTRFPGWDKFPIWMLRQICRWMWPYYSCWIEFHKKTYN